MSELPHETEFKLWLHPDDVDGFVAHPRLSRAKPAQADLHTLYFDTPDFQLAANKVALRVRKTGRQWVQTLKTEGQLSGGMSKRLELEAEVSKPLPDFSLLPKRVINELIPGGLRAHLVAVYETKFVRTAWNLRTADGSRIEVALDRGNIIAGNRTQPICEVELELKSGTPDALFALAELLAQKVLLIPFESSKAMRGVQLASGASSQPVKARAPMLKNKMAVCAGFSAILQSDLSQLHANLPGFLLEKDPEYCHQARVAIRRLRSAVSLFRKDCALADAELQHIATLGKTLGAVRDLDVFVFETLPKLKEILTAGQYALLTRRANRQRKTLRERAIGIVGSPKTGACLVAWQRKLAGMEPRSGKRRLGPYAAKKLASLQDRVKKRSRNIAQSSTEERHALRIALKRLRYAQEHFSSLLTRRKGLLRGLAELQDTLGVLNDIAVAKRLTAKLNDDGRLDAALRKIEQWDDQQSALSMRSLCRRLQLFSDDRAG